MGIFDGLTGQTGLFGLGGVGGLNQANTAQLQPLLGGMYNPQDMQKIQLKNMLLGAGIGLLSQKPSVAPITFGQTLGDGLAGGLQQAQQATDNYRQNALMGYQLQGQALDRARQTRTYNSQDAFAQNLPDDQKSLYFSDPTAYMNNYYQMKMMGMRGDLARGVLGEGSHPPSDNPLLSHPAMNGGVGGSYNTGASGQIQTAPVVQNGQTGTMQPDMTQAQPIPAPMSNQDAGIPIFDPANVPLPPNVKAAFMAAATSGSPSAMSDALKIKSDYQNGIATQQKDAYMNSPGFAAKKAVAENRAKVEAGAQAELPAAVVAAKSSVDMIDRLLNGNKFSGATGVLYSSLPDSGLRMAGGDLEARTMIKQLKGQAFLNSYNTLKGAGAISDTEGAKAEQAFTRLNEAQNDKDFAIALQDMKGALQSGIDKLAARGRVPSPLLPVSQKIINYDAQGSRIQ